MRLFAGFLVVLVPMSALASALADGSSQPKYPPSFDCSAVPAGSQRQACNRSHLDPPTGPIEEPRRVQPGSLVRPPEARPLPTDKPPTIPRLPGTIQDSN